MMVEVLIGFAAGFLVGTREGRDGVAKLRSSVTTIRESGDLKHLVGEAATVLAPIMREVARATGGQA